MTFIKLFIKILLSVKYVYTYVDTVEPSTARIRPLWGMKTSSLQALRGQFMDMESAPTILVSTSKEILLLRVYLMQVAQYWFSPRRLRTKRDSCYACMGACIMSILLTVYWCWFHICFFVYRDQLLPLPRKDITFCWRSQWQWVWKNQVHDYCFFHLHLRITVKRNAVINSNGFKEERDESNVYVNVRTSCGLLEWVCPWL